MSSDQLSIEKKRFFFLHLIRISGAVMIAFGLAIMAREVFGIPKIAGYALLAVGIFDFIVVPVLMSRAWRSKPDL